MTERPTIKVRVDATGHGTIAIDDHDISRLVTGLEIESKVGDVTRVLLHLIGPKLDVEVEVDPEVIDSYKARSAPPEPGSVSPLPQSIFNMEKDR